jgi:DNA invertase Pin-like site-specific DNA recombinase
LQRTAITDHCARRGYQLIGWVEGVDESGSGRRSPWWAKLDEAVGQIEAGEADVLVTWRFSRAARQRLKWAVAIDRVEVAGGLLESATEPLDTSTASGRLARGMLAEMAAYESEVIGSTWRETHARRTAKGLPANGKPRFGYRVLDGIHRPDPGEGPVLAELYRRYVAGESVYSLVAWLNAHGWRTVPGYSKRGPGPWTQTALRRCLDTGFGAGFITVHGERVRGIHEPVIDEQLWNAYLGARAARRTLRRAERATYLLTGLGVLRCAADLDGRPCGSPMGGGQFGSGHVAKYRCLASHAERRHPGGYVTMQVVETEVRAWVERFAADATASTDAALLTAARAARRRQDAKAIEREIVEVDKALIRLEANRAADREMPRSIYDAARTEMLAERQVLSERASVARAESLEGEPGKIAVDLARDWDEMPLEHLRAGLRKLLGRVDVVPGRPLSTVRVRGSWQLGEFTH